MLRAGSANAFAFPWAADYGTVGFLNGLILYSVRSHGAAIYRNFLTVLTLIMLIFVCGYYELRQTDVIQI